jgi:hypothetical protein
VSRIANNAFDYGCELIAVLSADLISLPEPPGKTIALVSASLCCALFLPAAARKQPGWQKYIFRLRLQSV